MNGEVDGWKKMRTRQHARRQRGGEDTGDPVETENLDGTYRLKGVLRARPTAACLGSWEYRVEWEGGHEPTYRVPGTYMPKKTKKDMEVWKDMEEARSKTRTPASLHQRMKEARETGRQGTEKQQTVEAIDKLCDGEGNEKDMERVWGEFIRHTETAGMPQNIREGTTEHAKRAGCDNTRDVRLYYVLYSIMIN